jgi:hypothetical protein
METVSEMKEFVDIFKEAFIQEAQNYPDLMYTGIDNKFLALDHGITKVRVISTPR